MSTGKLIYIITMGWTLIIHGGITYMFAKKQDFSLLSGYANRPEEEKAFLMKSGYLRAIAKLFALTFWLFLLTFIIGLFSMSHAFGIGLGVFIITLFVGLIWIQRYEVPHKRKKMTWIMSIISAASIIIVVAVAGTAFIENDVSIEDHTFKITGPYGVEWPVSEIESVEKLDELPKILFRSNGISAANRKTGHFKLEEPYGKGLLFIDSDTDAYLYIKTNEEFLILNRKDPNDVNAIYNELKTLIK